MFVEAFAFPDHALVNFVGGGGKTALIHRLMREYASRGPVLGTTTTRIHPPAPQEGFALVATDDLAFLRRALRGIAEGCAGRAYKVIASRHYISANLVRGVPTDFIASLDRECFPAILNEADGAASFSLKLCRDSEPVLAEGADHLVPVVGMDCLGRELGPDTVLRWLELSEGFALRKGGRITPQVAASLLMHPRGVCKGWCPGMRIVPFVNKADAEARDAEARLLAEAILDNGNFPVERVLYGSVAEGRVASVSRSSRHF
ncbi:MAG: putative selenium-dependent hydroxylase accessory protein YqeC [Acidobacteriota bacterium]|jgi:probable selenium-dependent hydroxylase accessory protein YqeC|nr:putative selenium-dependent hydroxylase accessory protein YqeC [Acidobacteriota bacterium]